MSKADYSEDKNVQEPAARLFADALDWRSVYAFNENFGEASLLGRNSAHEVVLTRELDRALAKLNPTLTQTSVGRMQLQEARDLLCAADSTKTLLQHNFEKWQLMREGISLKAPSGNAPDDVHIKVIDFDHVDNNDFLLVRELWVFGGHYKKRCDLVGFLNGLPVIFIEVKRHDKQLKEAFDHNYTDYKDTIPQLFHYNALVILSNGLDARVGSITSDWDHFYRWKRLNEDDADPAPIHNEDPKVPLLPILLRGLCNKTALLDVLENFTVFDESSGKTLKIIANNHQYLGVNKAICRLQNQEAVNAGKLGVIWHTQGSGKSYSMLFFCQKAHRKISSAYTFVLLTDRKELDTQIYQTFVGCGISTSKNDKATGAEGLARLLRDENRRYVFSLIHKFRNPVQEPWNTRSDVIVISDEAHRTQYGRLALNMRMALPNAQFIGFTGTPLIDANEKSATEQVFGSYVSIYDFQRAVSDGATLPLFYESHGQKLRLKDAHLNERIEARIDAMRAEDGLSEEQEEKLYRDLARDYPILTSETHLSDVASDLVAHFHKRWRLMEPTVKTGDAPKYGGNSKALLVCIDKLTCVKMAERIKEQWELAIANLKKLLHIETEAFLKSTRGETTFVRELRAQIVWMEETQIHPVFSSEQNEVQDFLREGMDVLPYRKKIAEGIAGKSLEACFKSPEHPFRIAIVCAMWLTGFDVKSLATLYLDKPMQGHTLMQAIARVNRVAANKKNGMIIDYHGMLESLRKALSVYAQSAEGAAFDPLMDEDKALAEYAASIARVEAHLLHSGFTLDNLINAKQGEAKQSELLNAQEALSSSVENKKTFLVLAEDVFDRLRGLFPNQGVFAFEPQENAIAAIYNLLQKPKKPVDISALMQEIRGVIDTSLEVIPKDKISQTIKKYDLSGIDFERLRVEFAKSPYQKTTILSLEERIEARLNQMMRENPSRINLYTRYQEIIAQFNQDKDALEIERIFAELMKMSFALDEEAERYVREGFANNQQLAVFDLLLKNQKNLTKSELGKIKKIAQTLIDTITPRLLVMRNLQDRAALQAQLKINIIDELLSNLPAQFGSDEIESRAEIIYRYVEQIHGGQMQ